MKKLTFYETLIRLLDFIESTYENCSGDSNVDFLVALDDAKQALIRLRRYL